MLSPAAGDSRYIIPIIASRDQFFDVSKQVTPELKALDPPITQPAIDRHGKPLFEAEKLIDHLKLKESTLRLSSTSRVAFAKV